MKTERPAAPDNPYQVPERAADGAALRADTGFAGLNRATRIKAGGQAVFAALCAGLVAVAGYTVTMEQAGLLVGAGIGLLVGASYLFGASRRWVRAVDGGLSIGGQLVPWSDVFFTAGQPLRGRKVLVSICFVEGGEPQMVSFRARGLGPDWLARMARLIRPWERLDEVERAFVRRLAGAPPQERY